MSRDPLPGDLVLHCTEHSATYLDPPRIDKWLEWRADVATRVNRRAGLITAAGDMRWPSGVYGRRQYVPAELIDLPAAMEWVNAHPIRTGTVDFIRELRAALLPFMLEAAP